MCLDRVEQFKPAGKGYQAKERRCHARTHEGVVDYRPILHREAGLQHTGLWYEAKDVDRDESERTYKAGHHVWHSLRNAKHYGASMSLARDVPVAIVQVELCEPITTGYQSYGDLATTTPTLHPRRTGKVTVCRYIRIVREVVRDAREGV